jgi:hypothetical protein
MCRLHITQHIRCGLTPLPFGTLLPLVATSYMLGTIGRHAAPQLVPKVGLSYNVEVEETMMEIGIDCWCGIIAAAYWGARVPGHGAGRGAAQRLSAGFPADAPYVPSGHIGNPGAPLYAIVKS